LPGGYRRVCISTKIGECLELKCSSEQAVAENTPVLVYPDFALDLVEKAVEKLEQVGSDVCVVFTMKIPFLLSFLTRSAFSPLRELTGVERAVAYYAENHCRSRVVIDVDYDPRVLLYMLLNTLPKTLVCLLLRMLRFIKFTLVGLTGFLVNLAVIYLADSVLRVFAGSVLSKAVASAVSFEASLTWNFVLHEYWTFRDLNLPRNPKSIVYRWVKFHAGSLGSFIAQIACVTLLSGYLNAPLYASLTIGVILGVVVNYYLSRTLAWRS